MNRAIGSYGESRDLDDFLSSYQDDSGEESSFTQSSDSNAEESSDSDAEESRVTLVFILFSPILSQFVRFIVAWPLL